MALVLPLPSELAQRGQCVVLLFGFTGKREAGLCYDGQMLALQPSQGEFSILLSCFRVCMYTQVIRIGVNCALSEQTLWPTNMGCQSHRVPVRHLYKCHN